MDNEKTMREYNAGTQYYILFFIVSSKIDFENKIKICNFVVAK
jgi:hypothetical protein